MQTVVRWCLQNKSVVLLATVILLAAGAYATTRLNQELLPEIEFGTVTVSTPVPGVGPDAVEEQVTRPVEDAVGGVEGVEGVRSTSSSGFSVVAVQLDLEADAEKAEAEISGALDGVELPQQAADPEVQRLSASSLPIMSISLSGKDGDLAAATDYARDEAVPLIEDVEGVAGADLAGGSEKQVRVELDPQRLKEEDLSADAVVGAISGASVNAPAGTVRVYGPSTPARVTSGPVDLQALKELPVGAAGGLPPVVSDDGSPSAGAPAGIPSGAPEKPAEGPPEPVLLEDVSEVREVDSNIAGISRTNGEPSLGISVTRQPDANTVDVARGVQEALGKVRDDFGEDRVLVVSNSAEEVEKSVAGLVEKALIGGALAIGIIFVFLRSPRATLVTAVSLPTSILAALLFSWAQDLTLNVITLAGLTIAVGRVVDDTIVVLENSYGYVQRGYEPEEAALKGTAEVASAITSSTLTTVAVFLPLGLIGGVVSTFFLPLSLTVTFALLASLLVSVTIIPVLTSVFIKRRPARERKASSEERNGPLARLYAPTLRWGLGHRLVVMLLALAVFGGGVATVPFLGVSFFPQSEERLLQADVELPAGTSLAETADEVRPFEDFLRDDQGVESYQLSAGGENGSDPEAPLRADNQAQALVSVEDDADVAATLGRLSEEGRDLYGDGFKAQVLAQGPSTGGLEITVTGGTEEELRLASERVVGKLEDNGSITNVESDLSEVSPEVEVAIGRDKVAEAGISPEQVPLSLGALLGASGQSLEVGDEIVSVGVREGSVDSLGEIRGLPLGGPGTTVADVAEVRRIEAPAEITRVDGERAVTVTGTITAEDTGAVSAEAQEGIEGLDLPEGVTATLGGESEDIDESFRDLIICVVVALALVYLVLVVFFGSLTVPLVILLSVPLIAAGSFGALLLTGTALSLPALLGVLLLIGIVVSNAILLVDFANRAQARHATVDGALIEAGLARIRPILMTALATIFALVPLAFGVGGGSGLISSSLAIPVVGGLVTSTLLTLFVVPVGYSLLKGGRRRKGGHGTEQENEPAGSQPPARDPETGASPADTGVPIKTATEATARNGSADGGTATAVTVPPAPGDLKPLRDRQDDLLFELGRARGQKEILERQELESRELELAETRRSLLRRLGG